LLTIVSKLLPETQGFLPTRFQVSRHQPVRWIRRLVTTPRQLNFVVRSLELEFPLLAGLGAIGFPRAFDHPVMCCLC
jgi:hypothetical protein